jgi:hypothetical protein
MKSTGLAKLVGCAVMLVACVALLPVVSGSPWAADGYSAKQAKPPERCVPRHLYASPQPECWRPTP